MSESRDVDVVGAEPENMDGSATLVEIEPGIALLLGDHPVRELTELGISPLTRKDMKRWSGLTDAIALASGGANIAAQGLQGAASVRGLVRFTQGTVDLLNSGLVRPMVSGGVNTGTLVNNSGKIVSQVKWLPATGSGAAAVLSSIGPAVALMAVQCQLMSISKRLNENIAITQEVSEELRRRRMSNLRSMCHEVRNIVEEVESRRSVDRIMFDQLERMAVGLREQWELCVDAVGAHLGKVEADPRSAKSYLLENEARIREDVCGLVVVRDMRYMADALRCSYVAQNEDKTPEGARRVMTRVKNAHSEHERASELASALLDRLERRVGLISELSYRSLMSRPEGLRGGGDGGNILTGLAGRVMTATGWSDDSEVGRLKDLSGYVVGLAGEETDDVPLPDPPVRIGDQEEVDDELKILRWILERDENLIAIASTTSSGVLGVTSAQVFHASRRSLLNDGAIERAFPLDDVRYVRFKGEDKGASGLDVISRQEDLSVAFSGGDREGARRVADLLATAMHLPDEERGSDPLMIEALDAHKERRGIEAARQPGRR